MNEASIPDTLRWLTLEGVAAMLVCSKRQAERVVLQKGFPSPARPTGGHRRWKATEIDGWLQAQRQAA